MVMRWAERMKRRDKMKLRARMRADVRTVLGVLTTPSCSLCRPTDGPCCASGCPDPATLGAKIFKEMEGREGMSMKCICWVARGDNDLERK